MGFYVKMKTYKSILHYHMMVVVKVLHLSQLLLIVYLRRRLKLPFCENKKVKKKEKKSIARKQRHLRTHFLRVETQQQNFLVFLSFHCTESPPYWLLNNKLTQTPSPYQQTPLYCSISFLSMDTKKSNPLKLLVLAFYIPTYRYNRF